MAKVAQIIAALFDIWRKNAAAIIRQFTVCAGFDRASYRLGLDG